MSGRPRVTGCRSPSSAKSMWHAHIKEQTHRNVRVSWWHAMLNSLRATRPQHLQGRGAPRQLAEHASKVCARLATTARQAENCGVDAESEWPVRPHTPAACGTGTQSCVGCATRKEKTHKNRGRMVEMVGTRAGMTHRMTHQRVRRLHKMWRCERDGEVWGGGGSAKLARVAT
jgi:hypothetical protein